MSIPHEERVDRQPRTTSKEDLSLAELLGGTPLSSFVARTFGKKSLFLPAAARDLIEPFGLSVVRRWIERSDGGDAALRALGRAPGSSDDAEVAVRDAERAVADGWRIFFPDTHLVSPPLARLAKRWMRELGFAGEYAAVHFLTAPGGYTAAHIDGSHNVTIQLAGTKQWGLSPAPARRLSAPALFADIGCGESVCEEEGREPFRPEESVSFTLEPGDALYVPRGAWHAVRAVGDAPSLSLAITFRGGTMADLARALLERTLPVEASRRELPLCPPGSDDLSHEDYCASVCDALRTLADDLRRDHALLRRELRAFVGAPKPTNTVATRPAVASVPTLTRDTVLENLQWPNPVHLRASTGGTPLLELFYEDGRVSFDEEDLLPWARTLSCTRRFRAGEATCWTDGGAPLEWTRVRGLLEAAIGIGLLR